VIVVSRFRVPAEDQDGFVDQARKAVVVLADRAGFVSADLGRNLDDPTLWTITTRWTNVGSYRRALQGYESKVVVVPLLSLALDEPSAYEDPIALDAEPIPAGDGAPRVLENRSWP
jgi:quinol monooxygenase YgiN